MPEVLHNICNMRSRDLPDMYARARGRAAPEGSCVHIRQITPAHVTYITYPTSTCDITGLYPTAFDYKQQEKKPATLMNDLLEGIDIKDQFH